MNLSLDANTVLTLLVIGHLITALLISTLWLRHKRDTTIKTFFFAKCLQAIAWCFLVVQGGPINVFTISLFNTMTFIGDSLETVSILKLLNAFPRKLKRLYIVLTSAMIIGFHFIILFDNKESLRIAFASIAVAILLMIPTFKMLTKRTSSPLTKIMGYLYLLAIVFFLMRAGTMFISSQSMSLFVEGITQTISLLMLYLIMSLGNTGFILLLKEKADQELVRLASYDDLTNTLNRRTFLSRAEECLTVCAKQNKPISMLLFDVDHFKKINDTHGHNMGDRVLLDLTDRIYQHLGDEDLFCRYGGDEFVILLPNMDESKSTRFAEQIRSQGNGFPFSYTLSMGLLTIIPDQHTQIDSLYISCDEALYKAKRNGRNQVNRHKSLLR